MKRKDKIPKAVRTAVWNTYIGNDKGIDQCFVGCGTSISQSNFECGHVVAEKNGGECTIKNLRPICGTCNKSIGTNNMEQFINKHGLIKHKNWDKLGNNSKKILMINSTTDTYKIYVNDKTIKLESYDFVIFPLTDMFGCNVINSETFKVEIDSNNNIVFDQKIKKTSKKWIEDNLDFPKKIISNMNKYHALLIF